MSNDFTKMLLGNIGSDLPRINSNNAFQKDGIWHCQICKSPLQMKIKIGDADYIVRKACMCEQMKYERMDREEQEKADREFVANLKRESMMDEISKSHTFSKFNVTRDNERNMRICKKYAEQFEQMKEKNQGLLMLGNPGTGKTFAASCIANYLLDHKYRVVMTSLVKLISMIQDSYGESEERIIEKINRAELLIIDDLGAERGTDYAIERVYNIIDSRYRKKKPMILTTNLSLQEMKSTNDMRLARIYDRVFEVCYPMMFTGISMRYETAARRFDEMKAFLEADE